MPPAPRFHLDESVTTKVADGLRNRERDCTTSKEAGLLEATDPDQLEYSLREGRVVITRDSDFVILVSEGVEHAGIIFWNSRRHFGQLIREIDKLASEMSAEEFHNTVVYL